ncbi:hypothetical protein ACWDRB_52715 [Nonomuraea sp. NPDC003707]
MKAKSAAQRLGDQVGLAPGRCEVPVAPAPGGETEQRAALDADSRARPVGGPPDSMTTGFDARVLFAQPHAFRQAAGAVAHRVRELGVGEGLAVVRLVESRLEKRNAQSPFRSGEKSSK